MGTEKSRTYDPVAYAAKRAVWDGDPKALAEQRRKWREAFRKRKGARPLTEIRAEQAEKRAGARALRCEKAASREVDRLLRPSPAERHKAWVAANRERMRELLRTWKVANPEKVRADRRGRKIRKSRELRALLTKRQGGKCPICTLKLSAATHIDHIMPKVLGGTNARSNLQLTCAECNLAIGAKDPIDFAQSMGRLL